MIRNEPHAWPELLAVHPGIDVNPPVLALGNSDNGDAVAVLTPPERRVVLGDEIIFVGLGRQLGLLFDFLRSKVVLLEDLGDLLDRIEVRFDTRALNTSGISSCNRPVASARSSSWFEPAFEEALRHGVD